MYWHSAEMMQRAHVDDLLAEARQEQLMAELPEQPGLRYRVAGYVGRALIRSGRRLTFYAWARLA